MNELPAVVVDRRSVRVRPTFLKANSSIRQIATDPSGNIYAVGEVPANDQDVFVAKMNPANAGFTWMRQATPTSQAALPRPIFQPRHQLRDRCLPIRLCRYRFAAKLTTNGAIVYSTLFSNGESAVPAAIAVDDAVISGRSGNRLYNHARRAYNNPWSGNPPFVTKLDPTAAKVLFSVVGVGGSSIALDAANNIFLSGSTYEMHLSRTPASFSVCFPAGLPSSTSPS